MANNLKSIPANLQQILDSVRELMDEALDTVAIFTRFVQMHMPKVEDGNNFGVSIQVSTLKWFSDFRKEVFEVSFRKLLPTYLSNRANVLEKMNLPSATMKTETVVETQSQSNNSTDATTSNSKESVEAGEDKNEKSSGNSQESKTSKDSSTKKTIETTSVGISDMNQLYDSPRMDQLVAIDLQCFMDVKVTLMGMTNTYMTLLDQVDKNMEKLIKPKGDTRATSHMHMY